MSKFFEANYQDILAVYSFGFLILGVVLFVLPKHDSRSRFIQLLPFLALFGLIHGATEFVSYLGFEHIAIRSSLNWVGAILLLVSFVPLLEFGRRMIRNSPDTPTLSALLYVALMTAIYLLSKLSDNQQIGFVAATRLFLGFPASLLSSYGFWKQFQVARKRSPGRFLLAAAMIFLVYGMATTVIPESPANLPPIFITEAQFLIFFGFPVQVLRAICAVALAAAVVYIVRNVNYESMLRERNHIREIARMDELKHINETLTSEIEQRHRAELQLKVLSMAFETQEAVMITDADGAILKVNQAFTRDTEYTSEEILSGTPLLLKSGYHDEEFYRNQWEKLQRTGAWQGEIWARRKSGEIFPIWATISGIRGENGVVTHYVCSYIDITERKRIEEKISFMAYHDQLTSLANRELFYDRLSQAISQARRKHVRLALLYLDLDGFKAINDDYGHAAGDEVLKATANRLLSCVRDSDTVARLGGDEFAVVLGEIRNAEDVTGVAEKILAKLSEPVQLQDANEGCVSASIGIALYPENGTEIDCLMSAADGAMYESKVNGKGNYSFSTPRTAGNTGV